MKYERKYNDNFNARKRLSLSKYKLLLFRENVKPNDKVSLYFFLLSLSSVSRKKLLLESDKSLIIVRYAYVKLCYCMVCTRNINGQECNVQEI